MTRWDSTSLSKCFEYAADHAENRRREIGLKMAKNPTYEHLYDEAMAEFYVFNRLHGRTFLVSREAFLAELSRMRTDLPQATSVMDRARFERSYMREIDKLISEFSATDVG